MGRYGAFPSSCTRKVKDQIFDLIVKKEAINVMGEFLKS
jgi:hypothetical protein